MSGGATTTQTLAKGARIVVIEARFYNDIADHLLRGVNAALEANGGLARVITVPGVAEFITQAALRQSLPFFWHLLHQISLWVVRRAPHFYCF